jgi:hypothetical protein
MMRVASNGLHGKSSVYQKLKTFLQEKAVESTKQKEGQSSVNHIYVYLSV